MRAAPGQAQQQKNVSASEMPTKSAGEGPVAAAEKKLNKALTSLRQADKQVSKAPFGKTYGELAKAFEGRIKEMERYRAAGVPYDYFPHQHRSIPWDPHPGGLAFNIPFDEGRRDTPLAWTGPFSRSQSYAFPPQRYRGGLYKHAIAHADSNRKFCQGKHDKWMHILREAGVDAALAMRDRRDSAAQRRPARKRPARKARRKTLPRKRAARKPRR